LVQGRFGERVVARRRAPVEATLEREGDDALESYLYDIRQIPLLTAAQEVVLGRAIAEGQDARVRLSQDDESFARSELARRISRGDSARARLIEANLRLVVSVARKYLGYGVPLLDLVQEGSLGLMRAVDKFDYRRGFKFSTYATWWIRQSVGRAVMDQTRVIRLPVHLQERLRKLEQAERDLVQDLGREIGEAELAEFLGISLGEIRVARRHADHVSSLDAPIGSDEESSTIGEFVPADTRPFDEIVEEEERRGIVEQIVGALLPCECLVLRLRYGFDDERVWTHDEVGARLGVSRERAEQIENEALAKLRHPRLLKALLD